VKKIRIKLKWQALDKENEAIARATRNKSKSISKDFFNSDTAKQLLKKSHFFLSLQKPIQIM
jgi:transposase